MDRRHSWAFAGIGTAVLAVAVAVALLVSLESREATLTTSDRVSRTSAPRALAPPLTTDDVRQSAVAMGSESGSPDGPAIRVVVHTSQGAWPPDPAPSLRFEAAGHPVGTLVLKERTGAVPVGESSRHEWTLTSLGASVATGTVIRTGRVTTLDLVLDTMPGVHGRIVDDQGRSIAGVTVEAAGRTPAGTSHGNVSTTTTARGGFRLPALSAGLVYTLTFEKAGYVAATKRDISLDPHHPTDLGVISLSRASPVSGVVVDGRGEVIAGCDVMATSDVGRARVSTGADGSFTFPSLQRGVSWTFASLYDRGVNDRLTLRLEESSPGAQLRLVVERGVQLRGRLVDELGDPVTGLRSVVWVFPERRGSLSDAGFYSDRRVARVSQEDGTFAAGPLPAGPARIMVPDRAIELMGHTSQDNEVVVERARFVSFAVRLVDGDTGLPVRTEGEYAFHWRTRNDFERAAGQGRFQTDASGIFPIDASLVVDDALGLVVLTDDYRPAAASGIQTVTASGSVMDVRLEPKRRITIRVGDEADRPIEGAEAVVAWRRSDSPLLRLDSSASPGGTSWFDGVASYLEAAITGRDGLAVLRIPTDGDYGYAVMSDGRAFRRVARETRDDVEVTLVSLD